MVRRNLLSDRLCASHGAVSPVKPLMSVLVPTRQRVSQLARMLDSLYSTAAEPSRVEVMARVDYDDDESRQYLAFREVPFLSLIHISEPTRLLSISYAVF